MSTNTSNKLLVSFCEGVKIIKFNRPSKKNAINQNMYIELTNILNTDASDDNIVVTIFTGVGDWYTSGNDLSGERTFSEDLFDKSCKIVQDFVDAFISYPKLLFAVVNGPAIGIGVTLLPLCDVVYASNRATFSTPFVSLGLCAEACSSYLFPRIMGKSKACEMLLLGRKLSAEEALKANLISEIIPHERLDELITDLLKYGKLAVASVKKNKQLLKESLGETLYEVNRREMTMLRKCLDDGDFIEAYSAFLIRKSKL